VILHALAVAQERYVQFRDSKHPALRACAFVLAAAAVLLFARRVKR